MNIRGAKRYPIRGLFAGLFAGIAIALFLVMASVVALGDTEPLICIVVITILGVAWSLLGPTRTRGRKPGVAITSTTAPTTGGSAASS